MAVMEVEGREPARRDRGIWQPSGRVRKGSFRCRNAASRPSFNQPPKGSFWARSERGATAGKSSKLDWKLSELQRMKASQVLALRVGGVCHPPWLNKPFSDLVSNFASTTQTNEYRCKKHSMSVDLTRRIGKNACRTCRNQICSPSGEWCQAWVPVFGSLRRSRAASMWVTFSERDCW